MSPAAPRQRPRITAVLARKVWLALVIAVVAAGLFLLNRDLVLDRDRLHVESERGRRLVVAEQGAPLPGTPDLGDLSGRLAAQGLTLGAPVLIRIFKYEFELELWMKRDDRFHRFAVYPICSWSGGLGPKLAQGDAQAPEGFYTVDAKALNPASRWHKSFNLGFPNALDRAHQRTGSFLMVHGGCASAGCYAMTNPVIDEIWRVVTAALKSGQRRFHVHVFPFRMTEENLQQRAHMRWAEFWRELKPGHDMFEASHLPPRVWVCQGRYAFSAPARVGAEQNYEIESGCPPPSDARS